MSEPTTTLTVAGVTFTADQVESAVLKIDGRTVRIEAPKEDEKRIGFPTKP